MEKIDLIFKKSKETKGTIVFQAAAQGKPPAISTVYVAKWMNPPDTLHMIVTDLITDPSK